MPRLLKKGAWYDPVPAESLYEADFEMAILQHAEALFPGLHCCRFKALVESTDYGKGRPDLALIDREYRCWWVVEVELDNHSFNSHVEGQVRKFATGVYTDDHVDALMREIPSLNRDRLADMMLGEPPQVLVLVTDDVPEWRAELRRYGVQVGVIQIFRDDLDEVILRVDGDQPSGYSTEVVSECTADSLLQNILRLHSPGALGTLGRVDLLIEGESSRWVITRSADTAFLTPDGRVPMRIPLGSKWRISRVGDDLMLDRMELQ